MSILRMYCLFLIFFDQENDSLINFILSNSDYLTGLVAIVAICLSAYSLFVQRQHNRRTFKPYCRYEIYQDDKSIEIKLWNKGNGPLIIKDIIFKDKSGKKKESIYDCISVYYRDAPSSFLGSNFTNHILSPKEFINLYSAKLSSDIIKNIKSDINGITIITRYKSVYSKFICFKWKDTLTFEIK